MIENPAAISARARGWIGCQTCGLVCRPPFATKPRCPRCGARVHSRKPDSVSRTWALIITAWFFMVPANILPIMTVVYFGDDDPDTIMSGIISLWENDMQHIAVVVFIASIIVPIAKLVGLMFLLICVRKRWRISPRWGGRLYHLIDWIGAWSMLDLFMISILVSLVNMGFIASVSAGPAASAFATVVILTMLAAVTFDPRLLWDIQEQADESRSTSS